MKPNLVVPFFALLTISWVSIARASIQYTLVDNTTLQDGYHLSGTITTDGATGIINQADISQASFTVSDSSGTTVFSGTTALFGNYGNPAAK